MHFVYLYFHRLRGRLGPMPLNLTLGPLALFTFVASITPGPNNLLLLRSGARFGVRRSVPHMVGIQLGFQGLLLLSWLGLGALLLALPAGFTVLRWACFAYLLWLALLILREALAESAAPATAPRTHVMRPMGLLEAMSFQLINAKAWMMTVTVASAFHGTARPTARDIAVAALVCLCIGAPSMLAWNAWGAAIEHVLKRPVARRMFHGAMALLVLATAVWMLL
jgi:threonine/homoserine/homoserine lactone efflux protein